MKKYLFLFMPILSLFIFAKCDKKSDCFTPPEPFRIIVNDQEGTNLFDPNTGISEYHLKVDNGTMEVVDTKVLSFLDETNNVEVFYLESVDAPWKSSEGNKVFYLQIGTMPIDTLYIDVVKEITDKCTTHQFASVKFNGIEVIEKDNRIDAFILSK